MYVKFEISMIHFAKTQLYILLKTHRIVLINITTDFKGKHGGTSDVYMLHSCSKTVI
jgi:hypothetical protein